MRHELENISEEVLRSSEDVSVCWWKYLAALGQTQ